MLGPTTEGILKEKPERILEMTADKGYEQEEALICCLENVNYPHIMERWEYPIC